MQDFTFKYVDDETYCVNAYKGDEEDVVIPGIYCGKPITVLYDDLFKGHTEIRSIVIPDCVTTIGGFVFDGCVNLKSLTLPSGLLHMWQYAMVRSSIEEIEIPGSLKEIIPFTFQDCKDLKTVVCHEGLIKIYGYAFKGCDKLEKLVVPENAEIDPRAVWDCPALEVIRK